MPVLISVIVTTYNRPDALNAVLRGLSRQSDAAFEVIIADDGSRDDTRQLVESWRGRVRGLAHVWQPDTGFRPGEARNLAVRASRGDYLIFLDGDCIPRADFVARHRRLARSGWLVAGNRILLSADLTERVLREGLEPEQWRFGEIVHHRVSAGLNRLLPVLRLPMGILRHGRAGDWKGVRTCNMAVWRADFMRVDGFDHAFNGWGREDSDLAVRLIHAGVRRADGRFATGVFHLWHREADRGQLERHDERLAQTIATRRVQAVRGLSTLGGASADAACASPRGTP
ncbi:MAG TPA: glycosyltransferase family 2 protein [Xanthobacteraceae bacterium]|nr:glycosyltransferase family 2 protein [Xanthobacteraceae bacterium]